MGAINFVILQTKILTMMKLHIFNPEHDTALASNQFNFVAPHAGREMRADLGFLPALWADDGDLVLVGDVAAALERMRHLRRYCAEVVFVTPADLPHLPQHCELSPWGWDRALRFQLQSSHIPSGLLPDDTQLDTIRQLSHRYWAATHLLHPLVQDNNERVGQSSLITSIEQLTSSSSPYVLKAPWSSSGRGIRYIDTLTAHQRGWAANVIARQGALTMEPYYHKMKDFAAEFVSDGTSVRYVGLSVFRSINGAYAGNVIASEADKRDIIARYLSFEVVERAIDDICHILQPLMAGRYTGPFGVDMMVINENGPKLHPCVELNLRRTMGHVALSFDAQGTEPHRLMTISYNGSYHFRIVTTAENCFSTVW